MDQHRLSQCFCILWLLYVTGTLHSTRMANYLLMQSVA